VIFLAIVTSENVKQTFVESSRVIFNRRSLQATVLLSSKFPLDDFRILLSSIALACDLVDYLSDSIIFAQMRRVGELANLRWVGGLRNLNPLYLFGLFLVRTENRQFVR
jgi:hypothetical protein